jgi:hypothetical protein
MNVTFYFLNLLQKVIRICMHYEWVNDQPDGSFPFRTGICGIRTAIVDILEKIKRI